MKVTIDEMKQACVLYNRVLSIRKAYPEKGVIIVMEGIDDSSVVLNRRDMHIMSKEMVLFKGIQKLVADNSQGQLCLSKVECVRNSSVRIWLKTI